ncbi:hypothetical protein [Peribacillus sp. SCS-155]|uniref:hypothetical protein n=1 Tax=Peribacillus sedimenti TaxID=3115297 RepID=UPI003906109F
MLKKTILQFMTALIVAASSTFAFYPSHSEAATINVASEVTKAQKKMKAPFDKYYQTQHSGKTVPKETVQKYIVIGQDAYEKATGIIKKYGGKKKSYYQASLDNYKRYLVRSSYYVGALEGVQSVYDHYDSVLNSPRIDFEDKFISEFNQMKYYRSRASSAFKNVYGPGVRDVLTKAYARVLTEKITATEDEAVVGRTYYYALYQETKENARYYTDQVQANLARIEPNTNYGRQLLDFVALAEEDIELHFP